MGAAVAFKEPLPLPRPVAAGGGGDDGGDGSVEEAAWLAALQMLQARLSTHNFRTYIGSAHVHSTAPGVLRLSYPTRFLIEVVRDHYLATLEKELLTAANRRIAVEFLWADPASFAIPAAPPAGSGGRRPPRPPVAAAEAEPDEPPRFSKTPELGIPIFPRRSVNGIDTRYTFEAFVVGPSNRVVHAACEAAADTPGEIYNPLFIYGGVGLGKTHLMQAVGNKVRAEHPDLKILYVTSEQFTNDVVSSIRSNRIEAFRRRYRECDLLLIDDVQFLAGKEATEEELFHTFNALYSRKKQIIVTSDKVPNEIDRMEDRLRSRFQSGLIVDVQPPELETRIAILRNKAEVMRLDLPDDVATFLATYFRQNVRELEGSLARIAAFASIMRQPITVEMAKDVLKNMLVNNREKVEVEQIIKRCAERFRVTVADIKGTRRSKHLMRARNAAMYLGRRLTDASYLQLGEKFGGSDHSKVINAVQRVPLAMAEDDDFRLTMEALERELSVPVDAPIATNAPPPIGPAAGAKSTAEPIVLEQETKSDHPSAVHDVRPKGEADGVKSNAWRNLFIGACAAASGVIVGRLTLDGAPFLDTVRCDIALVACALIIGMGIGKLSR